MPSYGTSFEVLSDEERSAVKRKPRAIHEEIVTDERGKRRFHGAFTGGFSAGYFNTVGTKEGWAPTTFKSSRESRAESTRYQTADFMDSEDLGEFGIASKRLRMKSSFADAAAPPAESNQLAWERSSTVATGPSSRLDDNITTALMDMLKPVTDSIGVQLMKKMGWRAGKGVGPSMTRRELERQKVIDAKESGKTVAFDETAVREVEAVAPDAEFCPTDAPDFQFAQKEDVHGLGYQPLQESGVLAQDYGKMAVGLKTSRRGRAIRGQAFGVGAYEDDDEDIYTTYDLSQYDFEVGVSGSTTANSVNRFDCAFVPATKAVKGSRKFFEVPKPPPGFRPVVKLPPEDFAKNLTEKILKAGERLTPFERAKFLGERGNSVLELLSDADRQRLSGVRVAMAAADAQQTRPSVAPTRVNPAEPFEEEPLKNHRFKRFVIYLRRGIDFPQPVNLTRLEWEKELDDFKRALTPELRALLPEVSSRQQPLAKLEFSQPIAEQLKSRFQSEANAEEATSVEKSVKHHADHDRVQAIRMNMFGELTRLKYKWYPSKEVCKRFNVPPPYPGSSQTGVLELQKRQHAGYDSMDFSVVGKAGPAATATRPSESARGELEIDDNFFSFTDDKNSKNVAVQSTAEILPSMGSKASDNAPFELLKALFQESSSEESSDSESDDDDDEKSTKNVNNRPESPSPYDHEELEVIHEEKPVLVEKVITVLDLVEDDDVYGPKPPPNLENVAGASRPVVYDIVDESIVDDRSDGDDNHRSNKHASKKSHKSGKHKKKDNKRKESKREEKRKKHSKNKRKARSRDSSTSSSGSSVEIIV